jgi:hypothetical protein
MKLALSSTAVANTSHFPVGITGAIVSNGWGDDVVGCSCASIRENSTHFQTGLPSKTGGIMNTSSSESLDTGAWRDLYKAALFEVDKARLPERIAQAEKALVLRARELFHIAGDNIEEEQALDDTMYALHALRNTSQTSHCIPHRSEAA